MHFQEVLGCSKNIFEFSLAKDGWMDGWMVGGSIEKFLVIIKEIQINRNMFLIKDELTSHWNVCQNDRWMNFNNPMDKQMYRDTYIRTDIHSDIQTYRDMHT